ncbi:MAG: MraY family glycosyltransferase [Tepidisphaeraceae bacterium]
MNSVAVGILVLIPIALTISAAVTFAMIRIAPKIGFVDKPGGRKIHANPKPLGGGVGVVCGLLVPLAIIGVSLRLAHTQVGTWTVPDPQHELSWRFEALDHVDVLGQSLPVSAHLVNGAKHQLPLLLAFVAGILVMHLMGLIDDRKALGPYSKLIVQLLVAGLLATFFKEVRALTAFGTVPSIILTVLWITAITNAFNFLDNMDGLSAGTAAVCTTAFLITTLLIGQWFVAATLACLLGALLGFLIFNFPPAKIFMGDAGSLVVGFVLGVLTVRTTFLPPGQSFGAGWYAVFAPAIVLAVPLYDLIVVSVIRISRGKSPFQGDRNHFSHRLVARGMSRRTAVLTIYLVSAATAIAAIILPHVNTPFAAMLIFMQTLLVLGVVLLLEQHPVNEGEGPRGEGQGELSTPHLESSSSSSLTPRP